MAFLTVKEDNVAKEGAGNFITTSGIYPVTLKAVEIAKTTNGAMQANYIMDKVMSYGNTIADKTGKPIFGMDILEALAAVAGESTLSDPEPTDIKFKTSTKTLNCIPELTDISVNVWVHFEYDLWQGQIKERVSVKRFYRDSDFASGSEVLDSSLEKGTRYNKDLAKASEVVYNDGITAEQVAAWKKAQAEGNKTPAAKPQTNANTAAFPGAAQ